MGPEGREGPAERGRAGQRIGTHLGGHVADSLCDVKIPVGPHSFLLQVLLGHYIGMHVSRNNNNNTNTII